MAGPCLVMCLCFLRLLDTEQPIARFKAWSHLRDTDFAEHDSSHVYAGVLDVESCLASEPEKCVDGNIFSRSVDQTRSLGQLLDLAYRDNQGCFWGNGGFEDIFCYPGGVVFCKRRYCCV